MDSRFSCRVVSIDYHLMPPIKDLDVCFSSLSSSAVRRVPVVTIFGATPAGQKTCLHVHGAFPYLLVPCGLARPDERCVQRLARSVNRALGLSFRAANGASDDAAAAGEGGEGDADYVFKISVVKGM